VRRAPAVTMLLAFVLLLAPPANAQTAPTLTLSASADTIAYGDSVTLAGTSSIALAGVTIGIVDATGSVVAGATTDAAGAFSTTIAPDGTDTYRASLTEAISAPVTVRVRAVLSVRLSPVRLFDTVTVRGVVAPAHHDGRVEVALIRGGRTVEVRTAAMNANGAFATTFRIDAVGHYRARASFAAEDLLRGKATSAADWTPLPRLASGDGSVFVELLEQRLTELDYRLAGAKDGRYDARTADAVVAFHKVHGMERVFVVREATWRRLARPRSPNPRRTWRDFHFEVDQTRQVLYTVEQGEITSILHISTGAGGATHDGTYRVHRKLAGFSPNHLYYPSYFDGLRALHGWTEVPTYAASHGCVRIPYWNARWVFALASYGTRVVIYH